MSNNHQSLLTGLLLGAGAVLIGSKLLQPKQKQAEATVEAKTEKKVEQKATDPEVPPMPALSRRPSVKVGNDGDIVIFACEQMMDVAREVATLDERVHLGSIDWKSFPDRFPNLFIQDARRLKWFHGVFLASFDTPEVIFEQLAVIYALPKYLLRSFRVIIPYYSTGTMERIATLGEVATAKTLARMLSAIPSSVTGPTQICVFDLHTLQNQFYFSDDVIIRMHSCISLLQSKLSSLPDHDNVAIAFPDDGAAKRYKARFTAYPLIVCIKVREGDKRIVKIKDGDAQGKHVVIVDDLVQSGGTLLNCAKAVRAAGARTVSCYCTHAVFPNDAHLKFVESKEVDHFWITNTNPTVAAKLTQAPFEVLSISSRVLDVISDPLSLDACPERDM